MSRPRATGPIITDLIPGEKRQLALKWTIYDPAGDAHSLLRRGLGEELAGVRKRRSRNSARRDRTLSTPTWMATSAIRPPGSSRFALPATAPFPCPATTTLTSGPATYPTRSCPASTIRLRASLPPPTAAVTPDGYPYKLSIEWMSPYRTQRLYKLLNAPKKFTPADMLAIQTDIVSPFDRYCAERFVYAVDHTPQASQRAKEAAELMRNWDGTMRPIPRRRPLRCYSREKLKELLLSQDWAMTGKSTGGS